MPAQAGRYFHSDNCTGAHPGRAPTRPGHVGRSPAAGPPFSISSFGEDEAGELYVTALGGSGSVQRLREAGTGGGLSIVGSSQAEGNAGSTSLNFQVSLAGLRPSP